MTKWVVPRRLEVAPLILLIATIGVVFADEPRRCRVLTVEDGLLVGTSEGSIAIADVARLGSGHWVIQPLGKAFPETEVASLPSSARGISLAACSPSAEAISRVVTAHGWDVLDLSLCDHLTDASLAPVASQSHLTYLDISQARNVTAAAIERTLQDLGNLRVLRMAGLPEARVDLTKTFSRLPRLTHLDLRNSTGVRWQEQATLPSTLEWLTHSGDEMNVLVASLAGARELRFLDLSASDVDEDGVRVIGALSHPMHLRLVDCTNVSDDALATLNVPLTALDLSGCTRVTEAGIAHVATVSRSTLRSLSLRNCKEVTALAWLGGMSELASLDVSGCAVAKALDAVAWHEFKDLQYLNVAATGVSDAAVGQIASCGQLQTLDLSGSSITGSGLRQLKRCVRLENLYLDCCDALIPSDLISVVAEMTSLRRVSLLGRRRPLQAAEVVALRRAAPHVRVAAD